MTNSVFHQINYVLPNEDIEDFSIIRKNIGEIENYNFNEIFNKYNVKNRILLVLLNQDNLLKVFSKLNLVCEKRLLKIKTAIINAYKFFIIFFFKNK